MSFQSTSSSTKTVQVTGQILRADMMFSDFHAAGTNGQIDFNHSFYTLGCLINLHAISDHSHKRFI